MDAEKLSDLVFRLRHLSGEDLQDEAAEMLIELSAENAALQAERDAIRIETLLDVLLILSNEKRGHTKSECIGLIEEMLKAARAGGGK